MLLIFFNNVVDIEWSPNSSKTKAMDTNANHVNVNILCILSYVIFLSMLLAYAAAAVVLHSCFVLVEFNT